jgi:hypothetical protein
LSRTGPARAMRRTEPPCGNLLRVSFDLARQPMRRLSPAISLTAPRQLRQTRAPPPSNRVRAASGAPAGSNCGTHPRRPGAVTPTLVLCHPGTCLHRHRPVLPGSSARQAPERVFGWMPGTSPGMTKCSLRQQRNTSRPRVAPGPATPGPALAMPYSQAAGLAAQCSAQSTRQARRQSRSNWGGGWSGTRHDTGRERAQVGARMVALRAGPQPGAAAAAMRPQ